MDWFAALAGLLLLIPLFARGPGCQGRGKPADGTRRRGFAGACDGNKQR
jgi:hypothetical protein